MKPQHAAGPGRVLIAPVTVSPTKPLTPSHLKLLLSVDVMHRATEHHTNVTCTYHPLAHAASRQISGFWEYLDRCHPGTDFGHYREEDIGNLYMEYQASPPVPFTALQPIAARAETGWAHPSATRLLDIWEHHYRLLQMRDPRFGRAGPAPMPEAELIDLLRTHDLCVDGRTFGAPVYLDATRAGLPLRVMVGEDGRRNYLVSTLRELVPQVAHHHHVVLAHDTEIRTDYRIVEHILTALGAQVTRLEFPRVPLDGLTQSTRHGGWHPYTVDALSEPLVAEFGQPAFALGMRLYLIAGLGRTAPASFSTRHLRRWTLRAQRLIDTHGEGKTARNNPIDLRPIIGSSHVADPYRLITSMLSREAPVAASTLLDVVTGTTARELTGASR